MRKGVEVRLVPADRVRLERVVADRKSPQKHVWRARIVLMTADGYGTMAIQTVTGKGKPTIWRWQARYMEDGADGLFKDRTRPPGKAPTAPGIIAKVVDLTLRGTPPNATHWTLRSMAKAAALAPSTVHRIWRQHGLKPHKIETFKLSNDPRFREQGPRYRRALRKPARACAGVVRR